jgi:molybdopterin converting factor small subunit
MPAVTIHIPASLREFSGGARRLRVNLDDGGGTTVAEVFERLHADAPGVVERALDERGEVREHVNVFVDGESIRAGSKLGLNTPVGAGTEVWILPAVSGG